MLDFTSALYLGMEHPSWTLTSWVRLTEGAPAALRESTDARRAAHALARLIGCERGTLMPSTLHAFWDLFGVLPAHAVTVYVDAGSYPVGQWGTERAAARGTEVRRFRHHDARSLQRVMSSGSPSRGRPIVVADGWCPGCGSTAPIGDYLEAVVARGGLLVVDDTQALGLLGSRPLWDPPFGKGGGGILKWLGIHPGSNILVIASLAKGFGVPMTVMAGSRKLLLGFEARSEARVHLSPVSMVDVRAAEHALTINQRNGDAMRRHLAANVMRFQAGVVSLGLRVLGGLFPVQAIPASRGLDPVALHRQLLGRGIRGVVVRPPCQPGPTLAFLLTTRHASDHVDHALAALAASLRCSR